MTQAADLTDARRPFGRLITAMVTPFTADLKVDLAGAAALATYLVDEQKNDALVINGTTGEAPTTTDAEKADLIRTVKEAVGDRAKVVAGVGTNNTAHTIELARSAEQAGADGLLVVTPYYNKPPQAGLIKHYTMVADATGLPILVYDIPGRSAIPVETETLCKLAEHPRIVGVKDAKSQIAETSWVLKRTNLAYYSGNDAETLPILSVGGVGVVGTSTHISGARTKELIEAFERGDVATAIAIHRELLPIYTGIFRTQGTILVKAAMKLRGLPGGPVRPPLVDATEAQVAQLRQDAADAGLSL